MKLETLEECMARKEKEYLKYTDEIQKLREECRILLSAKELDFQKLDELDTRIENLEKLRSNSLESEGLSSRRLSSVQDKLIITKPLKKQIRSALFQLQFDLIIKRDACKCAIEEAEFISSSGLVSRHSGHPRSKSGGNSVERRMIKRLHLILEAGEDLEHVKSCLTTTNTIIDRLNRDHNNLHKDIFDYGYSSSYMKSNHGEDWKTKAEACIKMDRAEALRLKREFAKAKDTTSK